MISLTVSRHDDRYEGWPDLAAAPDGTLVCVYRESMMHASFPFSRLVVRRSLDGGMTWLPRQVLAECVRRPEEVDARRAWLEQDVVSAYEETRARVTEEWQIGAGINCPRLICLHDGTLFLIADAYRVDGKGSRRWSNRIWRSRDSGETWEGPEVAQIPPGLVPSLLQLRNGEILVGLLPEVTGFGILPDEEGATSFCCRSGDGGHTWSEPVSLPYTESCLIDEVGYVELDDGAIVGYGRNLVNEEAHRPTSGLKVISYDGGDTWRGPFETWLLGCKGRPKPGLLATGEVCITFRCAMPNEFLAMHVLPQAACLFESPEEVIELERIPEDIRGQATSEERHSWELTAYHPGRTIILYCDRSVHYDGGYSGWVQLPSGDILVVDYITDDAPLAYIRSFLVSRFDYLLFPEGDVITVHPLGQPFRGMSAAMGARQYARNLGRAG